MVYRHLIFDLACVRRLLRGVHMATSPNQSCIPASGRRGQSCTACAAQPSSQRSGSPERYIRYESVRHRW